MKGPPSPPSSLPFPYSAMWLAHECQTTWQNMEMGTGKFRNVQDSGTCNKYISGRKKLFWFGLATLVGVEVACYVNSNTQAPFTLFKWVGGSKSSRIRTLAHWRIQIFTNLWSESGPCSSFMLRFGRNGVIGTLGTVLRIHRIIKK